MAKAGLLNYHAGRKGASASTFSATEKLCGVATTCGINGHSLTVRLPPDRVVRLREGDAKTTLMNYKPSDETARWTDDLRSFAAFLAKQDISLTLTPDEEKEWVRHWNENRKKRWNDDRDGNKIRLTRPELFQTELYRQFNRGSFEQGGRMYGGFWINAPKVLRHKLKINGKPTVELDFSGCAIRMLYHLRYIDYKDDPYRLDAIAAYEIRKGLPTDYFREGIKAITQALINDQKGKKPERIQFKKRGPSFRPQFSRLDVRKMIENKHAAIADTFGTGAGLFLQRHESDLALEIITELMNQGIVALPVHDAFLVDMDHKFQTGVVMTKLYRRKFGFSPKLKVSL